MKIKSLVAVLLASPLLASAATFTTIDSNNSQVQFHYQQMGVKMDGYFKSVGGQIHYDSTAPEDAKVAINVNLASVDTGSSEADTEVVKSEWLNADAYPEAQFTAQKIELNADNVFNVSGLLRIKNHEQAITFPVSVTEADNKVTFAGSFSMLRGDYAIGEGAWSTYGIVANDIRVDFTLVATE